MKLRSFHKDEGNLVSSTRGEDSGELAKSQYIDRVPGGKVTVPIQEQETESAAPGE